jgi:hypothetical protein
MAAVTYFTPTAYIDIETPSAPNPRLSASITSTATTITLTSGILVQAGTKPTDPVIFGIKNRDTGYEELCYVTSANISSDGKTLSSVVRGIARSGETGVDLTTAVTANQSAHPQDSEVRLVVAPQIFQMMADALRGSISSGGASWQIGLGTDVNITVYAANGDANKPYFQYNAATNAWVYSNDGVSSTPFGTGAGVTGGDGITVTAGDIDVDLTDTTVFKNARTGNEVRAPVTAVGDGKLDKTFMPTMLEDLVNSGTTVTEIDQALDGISANVTATNLNDLTDGTATALHTHGSFVSTGTFAGTAATHSDVFAHGLGVAPSLVMIYAISYITLTINNSSTSMDRLAFSNGGYDGTNTKCVYKAYAVSEQGASSTQAAAISNYTPVASGDSQAATVAVDATNVTVNWTKYNSGVTNPVFYTVIAKV